MKGGKNFHINLKLILDILEMQKKVLGVLNGSFLSSLFGRGNNLFNCLKGCNLKKKKFLKPWLRPTVGIFIT